MSIIGFLLCGFGLSNVMGPTGWVVSVVLYGLYLAQKNIEWNRTDSDYVDPDYRP